MIAQVRHGASMRSVAREYRVSLCTVRWWVRRAREVPLDEVDWRDRPPIPRRIQRTALAVEDLVLTVRRELKESSDLGEFGARAIQRELITRSHPAVPSVRTIGRILARRGALDGQRRVRRTPPPRGWYLPEVAEGRAELDSFDIIEGLVLEGGPQIEVLSGISLHGGLPGAWPVPLVSAKIAVETLVEHWQAFGLPPYAQFDNDTIFQGGHRGRDSIGRVVRICLQLGVTPVFAPPRESGFQAAIESFNGRWQAKVWARFYHDSLAALQERSERYILALRRRSAMRIEAAPERRSFPSAWHQDLQAHPQGVIIFIRRTSDRGTVSLLGHTFEVSSLWLHRLVRCELDLVANRLRFYALRRRDPAHQPFLTELPYLLPRRPFHG
jgi:hypothetical protein